MNFSLLKENQLMEIYVPALQSYCRVKLVTVEDDCLVIKESESEGFIDSNNNDDFQKIMPLEVGKTYLIYIVAEDNVYCGKSRLLAIKKENNDEDLLYIVEKPEELVFHERRHGSRVVFKGKVYYRLGDSADQGFPKEAYSVDLSRSGMRLITDEYYKPKTLLILKLVIEDIELCVRAKVKRVKKIDNNKYQIGIAFQDIIIPI